MFVATRLIRILVLSLVIMSITGCVAGSLATNTGPMFKGCLWSEAKKQKVHVGETVHFEFVLHDGFGSLVEPRGIADYCVAQIESDRIDVEPDEKGRFRFSLSFERFVEGEKITVTVCAKKQVSQRDFLKVGGRWLKNENDKDRQDRVASKNKVELLVYQSKVSFAIDNAIEPMDAAGGVLRLRKSDGTIACIYADRPEKRGFKISEGDRLRSYTVTYEPRGSEVNPTGQTAAELSISDIHGRPRLLTATFPTP